MFIYVFVPVNFTILMSFKPFSVLIFNPLAVVCKCFQNIWHTESILNDSFTRLDFFFMVLLNYS